MLDIQVKSRTQVFINAAHISISNFLFGYTIGVFNTCQDNVAYSMSWSSSEQKLYGNLFSTFIPIGALIGSFFTGYLSNKLGRLTTILIMDLITLIGAVLSVVPITIVFGLGRFIAGIASGMYLTISPIYISEMTPHYMMGSTGPIMALMMSFGLTLSFSLSFVLPTENFSQSINNFWQFMFIVPGILAIYQFIYFKFIVKYDTPLFYIRSKNYPNYKQILNTLFDTQDIPDESSFTNHITENNNLEKDTDSYKKLICDRNNSKMLRIGVILGIFQQFSGINAVLFYSFSIYQQIGLSVLESRIFTVSIGFTYLISSFFSIIILRFIGRKTSLLYGHGLICIVLVIIGLISEVGKNLSYFLAGLIILYVGIFNFALSATLWSYVSEIQTERAISITITFNYIANIIVNFMFPVAISMAKISYVFYFFGVCMFFATIYVKFDTIETKSKSKIDIEIEMHNKSWNLKTHEAESLHK